MTKNISKKGNVIFLWNTGWIFGVLVALLVAIDFVPEQKQAQSAVVRANEVSSVENTEDIPEASIIYAQKDTIPVRVEVPSVGIDTIVLTPSSTDVEVLDTALLNGSVHYPQSAFAGELGNMLIFGHSSYLPVVHNKAFQAFNELSKVKVGSLVSIYSETHVFEYEVKQVKLARAEDTTIYFTAEVPTLTLATCNTFGAKEDRWIVTATLSRVRAL
jgi:LPXTG-site transpeptidase (sortase) family protein